MGLAKKRLNVERSMHFTNIFKCVLLGGIGIFGGIMVLRNGIGTTSGRGLGGFYTRVPPSLWHKVRSWQIWYQLL